MINPRDIEQQNHGVILDEPLDTDLYLGSNDRVEHTITLEDRNWLPYYSNGELQKGAYYDTMGCVSFSANKTLEAVLNYLIQHKKLSVENVKWLYENGYLDDDNKVNLSDRYTTAMSHTTPRGNTGGRVWWTIRNKGVVPEAMAPWDRGSDVPQEERYANWYRNPDNISAEAKALGEEFVKRFDIFYERTMTTEKGLRAGLAHSPVQVFIPTACPYKNTIQQPCGAEITHAVSACDDLQPREYWPLFDHYLKQRQEEGQERFIRRVAPNYGFQATGYVCTVKEKNVIPNEEYMENNFVRFAKDKNSGAVGFFLPAHSPKTLENMARIYGKQVPKKEDGTIDWDRLIEGEVVFEQPLIP